MKKRIVVCSHGIYYVLAALILAVGIFLGLCQLDKESYAFIRKRRSSSKMIQAPRVPAVSDEVANASPGKPYEIFVDQNRREPKDRYEYKTWLKRNFTTDWEYWYDRYREHRAYEDGFAPGSGHFKYKAHGRSE